MKLNEKQMTYMDISACHDFLTMETIIPINRRQAFEQLDQILTKEEKDRMVCADNSIDYHFTLGLWIRNNWIYPQDEKDVNRLAKAFRIDDWFIQPDDLSDIIIKYYIRYLKRNKE